MENCPATREGHAPLAVLLDKIIVVLMVAILLTMSWPVSLVLWGQSHVAHHIVASRSAPEARPPTRISLLPNS